MTDPDHDHEPDKSDPATAGAAKSGPPAEPALISLPALLETVHASVVTQVRQACDSSLEHLLARYFPLDPQTGRMTPKTVQVPLPGPNGTPILREVPLFLLANHHDVAVENFVIRLKTGLHEKTGPDGASLLMLDLANAGGEKQATAEVEIQFRGSSSAQGIARINEAIVKQIGGEER
ncbi:hypothetical protein CHU95_05310 [Niveispirillum lacus]|uniref:DUF2589 domain-containing protein n=1 Tax=Niveispirillum lacus TaxID=1981099 RepID=A0A255Z433_9PROT|nr:hypothetical protein [Niveispirillum lacus]OYQ36209.1 hypothetical protein CHU95_05310 [Niveispirillum lacus]